MDGRRGSWRAVSIVAVLLAGVSPAWAQGNQDKPQNDPALRSYLSGNGLLSRGMYELAVKEYRDFLNEHPDHEKAATARYGLGVALVRLKKFDEAAEALKPLRGIKGFEFAAESELLLAQCDLAQGRLEPAAAALERLVHERADSAVADDAAVLLAETGYRSRQFEKTESACRDLLARKPQSPQKDRIELLWGMASMAREDYAHAAEHLGAVASRVPGTPIGQQALLLQAQCVQRTGDVGAASELFEKAAADKSSTFAGESTVGLATLRRQQGQAEQAGKLLDKLLKDSPDTAVVGPALLERGRVWFDLGKYDQARQIFAQAADKPGVDADQVEYWAAKCDLRSGDPASAASRLEQAIGANPKSRLLPEMTYDRGIALLRAGKDSDAAGVLTQFRSKFPEHSLAPDALEAIATIEHRAKQYDRSLVHCAEFAKAYPKHALRTRMEFLAAENLVLAGKTDEAVAAFRSFVGEHGDDQAVARAKLRLGTLLFSQAKYDDAKPLLEESAVLAAKDEAFRPAVLCLGDLYFQKSQWKEAEAVLARYEAFGDAASSADDAALKRGLALERLGQNQEALREFDRLLERFPKSQHRVQAMFERGQTLTAMGKTEEARSAYKQVLKDGQGSPFAPYALTQLGSMSLQSGDASAAAERFESAAVMASDPETKGEAMFQKGQALLASQRYADAAEAFGALLSELPEHKRCGQARAQRAIAMARVKRDQSSLHEIDAAVADRSLDEPTRQALAYERACCLRELGQADEANKALRDLAGAPAGSAVAPYAMLDVAASETDAGHLDAAADLLTRVRASAQGDQARDLRDQATYRLAVCRFKQDKARDALNLLDEYFKADPKGTLLPAATLLAGECRFKLGRNAEAAQDFRRIVDDFKDDPAAPTALLRLGDSLAAAQDWGGSEQAFSRYLKQHADSDLWFQAQFGLGWARENQGRPGEAMECYRKVVDKHNGPTAARAQFQIGECLFAQKKFDEAARELVKVDILYAYPEWSAAALYEAGRCFESLNKSDQATEQFRQVQQKYPDSKWAAMATARLGKAIGAAGAGAGR